MNIFIAEDRLQDYLYLRRLIEKWSKSREVEIKIYFRNRLYYQIPDVIHLCEVAFIDIHMPEISGIEFCKYLRCFNERIEIIFQSMSYHYGVESYRINALDYLLKPLREKDIFKLLDMVLFKNQEKCLVYKQGKVLKKVKFENILYLSVEKHRCMIHCIDHNEEIYVSLLKLKELLDKRFMQCYRSYIVNIDYIKLIKKEEIILFNNEKIPLSRKYNTSIKETFMKQI